MANQGVDSNQWRKLDNAAKVFPATANKKNTKVFRFYCELHEPVEAEYLQFAMEMTLEKYPLFKSVLRQGIFWFYLEKNEFTPIVKEERKSPCSILYTGDKIKYLFRVNYYKNRINFEVFHVLTDGTGATQFLREMVKNYLYLKYKEDGLPEVELTEDDITFMDHEKDAFTKYYSEETKKLKKKGKGAHQIRGIKTEFETLQVIEGVVDTKSILAKAKEHKVSLTVFLTAVFIYAIHQEMSMRQEKKPVVMMVPVNLRNFFPSQSMTNFFGYIDPGYQFDQSKEHTLEDVIEAVKQYFEEELTEEKMAARMNEYTRLEQHPLLRLTPLGMKNIGIQAGFATTVRDLSAIFSNMSVVKMPPEYEPYIKQFGVFTSTHKIELCMCSFKDRMVLNFTSYFDSANIPRNFFRDLKNDGIEVEYTKDQFPEINEEDKKKFQFQQCVNFASIVLIVLSFIANVLWFPESLISLIGVGIVGSLWITLTMGFNKRKNLLKNGLWQLAIFSIGAIIWDVVSGYHGWSLDYLIPIMNMGLLVSMSIIANIQKLKPEEYMMYMVINILFAILQLPFLLLGIIQAPACAVFSIGLAIVVFSFLLIFKKRQLLTELHKNLHI